MAGIKDVKEETKRLRWWATFLMGLTVALGAILVVTVVIHGIRVGWDIVFLWDYVVPTAIFFVISFIFGMILRRLTLL